MTNIYYAFLLTFISGISTIIGYLFIYIKGNRVGVICKSLGFASGVMITISLIDLLPNSYQLIIDKYNVIYTIIIMFLCLLIGSSISLIVNKRIQSREVNKLYKIGIISAIIIVLHNIPEGIITYITASNNIKLGLALSLAITLHNIPEGISISIPIYYSTNSRFKAFIYTFISGISEPLGAVISYLFLSKYINNFILGIIYSIIAGMMLNIGYGELYKEAIQYNKKNAIIYSIIGGFLIVLNHILIN